jgi:hypothetical protein
MPPSYGGAGSGAGDAGWMGSDVPDEAVLMRTPDITQEQVPGAVKVSVITCYMLLYSGLAASGLKSGNCA